MPESKKYEFVEGDEIKTKHGATLKRIRSLVSIPTIGVEVGSLGGYIGCEENLKHTGNAWVYCNAQVYGDAQVSGDAQVYGFAQVSGDAQVYGCTQVYGNAEVYGEAEVYGDAQVYGNARVYRNAKVYGAAQIYGDARVYDTAWVDGYVQIYGDARVYGDAYVRGDARVYGSLHVHGEARVSGKSTLVWFTNVGSENGTLTIYPNSAGTLSVVRGCFHGSVDEFLTKSAAEHDARTRREYELLIEVARSRLVGACEKIKTKRGVK